MAMPGMASISLSSAKRRRGSGGGGIDIARWRSEATVGKDSFGEAPLPARSSRGERDEARRRSSAFTLLELLTVIAIVGIVAALAAPSLRALKPNAGSAATRQLLDAANRARQLAISTRSTVYMVFVPPSFWTDPNYGKGYLSADTTNAQSLFDKQMIGYAYLSLRSVGDQPGMSYPRYLSSWRTLPAGAFIAAQKFTYNNPFSPVPVLQVYTNGTLAYNVFGFNATNIFPFPAEQTPPANIVGGTKQWIYLPYIAFDGTGAVASGAGTQPEVIPITEGNLSFARDPNTKVAVQGLPQALDVPSGNTTNNYNLVYLDQLTGRGRIEHVKVQ
jgi:prepilin-type N-terminal cleavage/methylation domain-containing protein